ncbi:hypothetical protein OS493_028073 [Desmophyllum pertusum]|uniref:Uncharacterized protein n=1 Tax=Desmophyllum pertusum TaxID=174260 RepID=A0A9X0D838_9CNID|nr:hypothetical protein OS493_028073 [Desmophyllum pertusum]
MVCDLCLGFSSTREQQNIEETEEVRAVRDVPVEISYEPVGCFKDKKDRALKLVINYRGTKNWPEGKNLWTGTNWPDMSYVIQTLRRKSVHRRLRHVCDTVLWGMLRGQIC